MVLIMEEVLGIQKYSCNHMKMNVNIIEVKGIENLPPSINQISQHLHENFNGILV